MERGRFNADMAAIAHFQARRTYLTQARSITAPRNQDNPERSARRRSEACSSGLLQASYGDAREARPAQAPSPVYCAMRRWLSALLRRGGR